MLRFNEMIENVVIYYVAQLIKQNLTLSIYCTSSYGVNF